MKLGDFIGGLQILGINILDSSTGEREDGDGYHLITAAEATP